MSSRNSLPFYCIDDLTNWLTPVAQYALRIANLVRRYRAGPGDKSRREMSSADMQRFVSLELVAYSEDESDRYAWIADDFLVRDLVHWIATDDFKPLLAFLEASRQYARCFGPVGKEKQFSEIKQAEIHTLAACIRLAETFDRDQVTKAQIRRSACKLWSAGYKLRGKADYLPDVQWSRVYRALGLDDLRADSNSREFCNLNVVR